jgi:RHS repeat-associated protein
MKFLKLLLLLIIPPGLWAQTSTQNYIVTTAPFQAVTDPTTLTDANSNTTIQYFDGLGRLSQTVQQKITPNGADLVSAVEYDAFGRESKRWLPAVAVNNAGAYYPGYSTQAVSSNGGDAKPYSTTEYEPSPLNRVTGQYGPGNDWYTNLKKVATAYTVNAADVKYFYVEGDKLKCNGKYAAATLYGVQTTDEDGKTVVEYTDKLGRKVLSCVAGNYNTYYVYDDLGNLRYVLPPLASDNLDTNTSGFAETSGSTLDQYGYIYRYDSRNRLVEKKLPGADWVYLVYDKADRLILAQDGNQRAKATKEWTVYKYDKFGRLLYSGILTSGNSRTQMETAYSASLTHETYTGSGSTGGYSCTNLVPASLLTVNYYDGYSFLNLTAYSALKSALTNTTQSGYTAPDLSHVNTMLTGACVYHLDDPAKFELTAIYYDKYGRTVQTRASNQLAGYDIAFNLVDFTGKPVKTYKTHGISGASATVTEVYAYTFDKAQRLLTTTHQLNGGSTVTLAANAYDELGRLATKTLGGTLDGTTYAYNVRGWLSGIIGTRFTENLYYNANPVSLPSFTACYNGNISGMKWSIPGESLGYDRVYSFTYDALNRLTNGYYCGKSGTSTYSGTTGKYNESANYDKMGNITSLTRYENGNGLNNLAYTYTGNQLKKVDNAWAPTLLYGSEAFNDRVKDATEYLYDKNGNTTYDANGAISTIQYNLLNLAQIVQFTAGHQNRYSYGANGQKLTATSYTLNTAITVPQGTISALPSNPADYIKVTTDYIGNKIYQNSSLKQIQTPEGYCQNGVYYYYLKDHLGNTRVVINSSGTIVEKSHYYPFGMRFYPESTSNSSALAFRYNGKEFESMNGLNRYDYGARMYDAQLGRWHVVDPLAEKGRRWSPYTYVFDNPMRFIDPDGMWADNYWFDKNGELDKYEKNDQPDHVYVESGKSESNEKAYTELDAAGTKQFVAIVVGESSNNSDEAKGISNVMLNRMDNKGVELKEGFVDKIGGTKDFDAIGGTLYNKVMGQSLKETLDSDVSVRAKGAISALSPLSIDNTKGAFFWNATSQKDAANPGWNWSQFNKGVYSQTTELGKTTFFKYNPDQIKNPTYFKNTWP